MKNKAANRLKKKIAIILIGMQALCFPSWANEIQMVNNQPVAVVSPDEVSKNNFDGADKKSPVEAFESENIIQSAGVASKQSPAAPKVNLKVGEFAAGVCGGLAANMPTASKCVGTVRTPSGLREIFFVSKMSNEHIMIYDRKNNRYVLADVRGGNGRKVGAANISTDGRHLVVAVALKGVDVYNLETMKRIASNTVSGASSIRKVEFTHGKSVAATSQNGKESNFKLVNQNGKTKLVPAKKPAPARGRLGVVIPRPVIRR